MNPSDSDRLRTNRREQALAACARAGSSETACDNLLQTVAGSSAEEWLTLAQDLVLRHNGQCAGRVLEQAATEHPGCIEILHARAGLLIEQNEPVAAEALLRRVLEVDADSFTSALLLARLLKEQGRMHAAAEVMRAIFDKPRGEVEPLIHAIELLDDCGRKRDAAAICETEIDAGCSDPRLHAYAGMLQSQLGHFELARERYAFVVEHSTHAPDWHAPLGLAGLQRYQDREHPDFALFQRYLAANLNGPARASLLFALGKAHDDIGEYRQAVSFLREANALAGARAQWSRKLWRRRIEARRQRRLPGVTLPADENWTPVFIVGVPRSGTTLLAQWLTRHESVCQRGELPWLASVAELVNPTGGDYRQQLQHAAAVYTAQLRQDDAAQAHWFVDKQPHNFLHVDLILSLFPNARIIQCQRSPRDNALSLWMQSFHDSGQDFSYDFADIAAFIRGARQLMAHWQMRYPDSVRTVAYEELVTDPSGCLGALSSWLGLPTLSLLETPVNDEAISTASLWQARQPIHTRSVARWRVYETHLPELLQLTQA